MQAHTCDHDWNEKTGLRLVVETPDDVFADIIPMAPRKFPVEYCRLCGFIRVPPVQLEALRAADADAAGKSTT